MGEISGVGLPAVGAVVLASCLCAALTVWTVALIIIDARQRRLPDALTLPAAGIAVVVACLLEPRGFFGLIWPAGYLVAGRGFGGGDVKLAVSLGVALACAGGVGAVLTGMLLASALTVGFLLLRREKTAPHGPSMLASAWIVGFASTFLPAV